MNALSPERWSRLWQNASNKIAPEGLLERLQALYNEPHRHYHNLLHIADCLNQFDQVRQLAKDPHAVEFAIWFHDSIYDSRAGDNEERSAEWAAACLNQGGVPVALANSVQQLILSSKAHDGALHPDAPLLVDVDLSILGKPAERFWEYERQIRQEYSWVEAGVFAGKRAEILERFLERRRIYLTEYFHSRWEAQARRNLQKSIQRLRAQVAS